MHAVLSITCIILTLPAFNSTRCCTVQFCACPSTEQFSPVQVFSGIVRRSISEVCYELPGEFLIIGVRSASHAEARPGWL